MIKAIYILFFCYIPLVMANKVNAGESDKEVSKLRHTVTLTYESYFGYQLGDGNETYLKDKIVNTSIFNNDEEAGSVGLGIRYSFHMDLSDSEYAKSSFFAIGAEFFADAMIDNTYSDLYREAFSYGIIPHIRVFYIFKLGYGFGYINFRESYDMFSGNTNYSLHDGIRFYHIGINLPYLDNFNANASVDFAENNFQFVEKWNIIRFRFGIGIKFN